MPLPPLPKIEGDYDLVLDIYTHNSLRYSKDNDEYGNTDRLQELGEHVLKLAVTQHYFDKRPILSADEIKEHCNTTLSDETLKTWMDGYGLMAKLFLPPGEEVGPVEIRRFFNRFVGALHIRSGNSVIRKWVSQLIDPVDSIAPAPEPPANWSPPDETQIQPSQPALPPPPLPTSIPPNISAPQSLISLALVNQTAVQQRRTIEYSASMEGQPHLPTWTVRCLIDNVERGRGVGKNQKIAKEEAARAAWVTMGW